MIGDRIKQLRKALGLTQEELGRIAGISKAAVSAWERERSKPDTDSLLALERKKRVNIEWVRTGKGEMLHTPEAVRRVREQRESYGNAEVMKVAELYERLNEEQRQAVMALLKVMANN